MPLDLLFHSFRCYRRFKFPRFSNFTALFHPKFRGRNTTKMWKKRQGLKFDVPLGKFHSFGDIGPNL